MKDGNDGFLSNTLSTHFEKEDLSFIHGSHLRVKSSRTAIFAIMPWSHLSVKPPRMSNVRQFLEVPRNCNVLSRSATYTQH